MQRLKTNVLIDCDTFLHSANQINLLSFSIHFLGKNLTHWGLPTRITTLITRKLIRGTLLWPSHHYKMNVSNAQTACKMRTTLKWNFWEKKNHHFCGVFTSLYLVWPGQETSNLQLLALRGFEVKCHNGTRINSKMWNFFIFLVTQQHWIYCMQ